MRVLLAMLTLCSCAAPRQFIDNDLSIARSRYQPSTIRSQTALTICEGRSGPMASWAFAREIRLVCSKQRSELLVEFLIPCGGTSGSSDGGEERKQ